LVIFVGCGSGGDAGDPEPTPEPSPTATPEPEPTPEPTPTAKPPPDVAPTPSPTPIQTPTPEPTPAPETAVFGYEIVDIYPHDYRAFTQGLEFHDGYLYESTGLRGESTLRRVDLDTGEVLQIHHLDDELFGEGLTILNKRIYQLTWHAGIGFLYDLETFELIDEFEYEGEGWGLANDGERLIMSDGSSTLYFRDLETFEVLDRVNVYDERGLVLRLNELEYIDGHVWANVWLEDYIVIIDPETGWVTGRVDLTGLPQPEDRGDRRVDVLNGIAYDLDEERIFVTGKLWPALYEIELVLLD
jgi:glutaminyl-peptide cyclotransferase